MSFQVKSIITEYLYHDDDLLIDEIKLFFPNIAVKKFHSSFHGIIGQIDELDIHYDCEALKYLEKHNIKNCEAAAEKVIFSFSNNVILFSKKFPNRKFAFIDVNCFGGVCFYEGFIAQNGKVIFEEASNEIGHINLLQQINPHFSGSYFEPFTRNFFTKKGKIEGIIEECSTQYLNGILKKHKLDSKYYDNGNITQVILTLLNPYNHKFEYYLSFAAYKNNPKKIELTGVIFNDAEPIINEIENIIKNIFNKLKYNIKIALDTKTMEYYQ